MRRRLFERFEKCIPGSAREHVHFVDDVYFPRADCWWEFYGFAKLADIFDTVIRGAVYFNDVEGTTFGEGLAIGTGVAGLLGIASVGAVDGFGKESRDSGFAGAARTGEEVGVGEEIACERIGERRDNVRLSGDVIPVFGAVFSVKRCHREMEH